MILSLLCVETSPYPLARIIQILLKAISTHCNTTGHLPSRLSGSKTHAHGCEPHSPTGPPQGGRKLSPLECGLRSWRLVLFGGCENRPCRDAQQSTMGVWSSPFVRQGLFSPFLPSRPPISEASFTPPWAVGPGVVLSTWRRSARRPWKRLPTARAKSH